MLLAVLAPLVLVLLAALDADASGEHGGQPLHVHCVVHVVDLSDGVADDAQVAAQLRDHCGDLLRVAQHLHALRVGVVAHPKRPLDLAGELPAHKRDNVL